MKESKVLNLGLCKGDNHKISNIKGYIFTPDHIKNIKNPNNDNSVILNYIYLSILHICFDNDLNYLIYDGFEQTLKIDINAHINLYIKDNANIIALIYVLNACKLYGIGISIYHYDNDADNYFLQEVL